MTEQEQPAGMRRPIDWKRMPLLALYVLAALYGVYLLSLWLVPALTGFQIASGRKAEIAPLVKQARADGITYERAAAPDLAGKYAVWCVQNRGEASVTVDGDARKPLRVSNYRFMPAFSGSKHEACTPMLLLLQGPAEGAGVRVSFKEALKI